MQRGGGLDGMELAATDVEAETCGDTASRSKKQDAWIRKLAKKKKYALNPNWMMHTNLAIWLSEMEETFGSHRHLPVPSGFLLTKPARRFIGGLGLLRWPSSPRRRVIFECSPS